MKKLTIGSDFNEESLAFQSYVANHAKSLQELTISNFEYFNANIYQLAAIKKITIDDIFISAQEFVNIFKQNVCPNLLEFGLSLQNLENVELSVNEEEACIVPTLRKLDITLISIEDVDFFLKMFPGLRELRLDTYGSVFWNGFPNVSHSCLRELIISGSTYADKLENFDVGKAARHFPNLEVLAISNFKIEVSDTDQQFEFSCLKKLELNDVEIDDETIKILAANLPVYIDLQKCFKI